MTSDQLAVELEKLTQLVAFYQGEGADELPEEAEWKQLAAVEVRTPNQQKRLAHLADFILRELDPHYLRSEIARLKRGDFTPEEFQSLCHHRDERPGCTRAEFEAGCVEYQAKLFGQPG